MLSFCKKQIKYFLVIPMVMMVIFVFVLFKTPISEVNASGLIDNDTTNKVVTMTGTNYTMIFDYNLKAKITSFKQGTNEILDTQGIISAVNNGTMGNTMGNTGEGSVRDSSTANCICAFKYTADSSFTATNVHIKMYDAFSSGHFKVAIYSDNSGTPGSMLGTTNEYTSLAVGWNTLDLSSNVELTSGTSYWLVEWGDAAYAIYGDVSGGTCRWDYYTYGTWPSGDSVSWTSSPGNSSIYAANY